MSKYSTEIIAKLLAQEDVIVNRIPDMAAWFDPVSRIVSIPAFVFPEEDKDVEFMLTAHEISHALFTPKDYESYGEKYTSLINILDDARIEKLVKRKYPGISKVFNSGYKIFHEKYNFFKCGLESNIFADRFNLHFKIGFCEPQTFNEEEKIAIEEFNSVDTYEQLIAYYRKYKSLLLQRKAKTLSLPKPTENDGPDIIIEDDESAEEATEEATEEELVKEDKTKKDYLDNSVRESQYIGRSIFNGSVAKKLQKSCIKFDNNQNEWYSLKKEEMTICSRISDTMYKEYMIRKNARERNQDILFKTGKIDLQRLSKYQITDNIFKDMTVRYQGKNHGIVLVLDNSGSMYSGRYMNKCIMQIMIVIDFCKKANIKFEFYAFSDASFASGDYNREFSTDRNFHIRNSGHLTFGKILDSSNTSIEIKNFKRNFSSLSHYDGGTAMLGTIFNIEPFISDFFNRNKIEKKNIFFISDGAENDKIASYPSNYFDVLTKKEYPGHIEPKQLLFSVLKERTGAKVQYIFLSKGTKRKSIGEFKTAFTRNNATKNEKNCFLYDKFSEELKNQISEFETPGKFKGSTYFTEKQKIQEKIDLFLDKEIFEVAKKKGFVRLNNLKGVDSFVVIYSKEIEDTLDNFDGLDSFFDKKKEAGANITTRGITSAVVDILGDQKKQNSLGVSVVQEICSV